MHQLDDPIFHRCQFGSHLYILTSNFCPPPDPKNGEAIMLNGVGSSKGAMNESPSFSGFIGSQSLYLRRM